VSGDPLNKISLVDEESYTMNFYVDTIFETQENTHSRYACVVSPTLLPPS
jgi:hypothetical protein